MPSNVHAFGPEYIHALRNGDPATEAHFVSHFSPILLRTLSGRVRSDQAHDLRQVTFLRVLAAVRSGRGVQKPERFDVFVVSVCKNVVRETYREQRRMVALSSLEVDPVADMPSPHAIMVAEECRGKVRRILSQLALSDQNILQATSLEERNADEICKQLGFSRSYLRVRVYRAKKRFLDQIKKDAQPSPRPQATRPVVRSSGSFRKATRMEVSPAVLERTAVAAFAS